MPQSQAGQAVARKRRHAKIFMPTTATLALGICISHSANAQTALAGWHVPRAGRTVVAAPTLRTQDDMDRFAAAHPDLTTKPNLSLAPRPTMAPEAYAAAKAHADAQAAQARARPAIAPRGIHPLATPSTIVLNHAGPNQTQANNGVYPPDITGAIGTKQIVVVVNNSINVYARTGKLQKTTALAAFFGTGDATNAPRVVYDPLWNRWVVTASRVPPSGDTLAACFFLAVSQTGSATGAWLNFAAVCQSGDSFAAGDLWDYDQLGLTQDAILVTGNLFSSADVSKGPIVAPLPKALVYNGQAFTYPDFVPGTQFGTIAPPNVQDSNAKAFLLATDNATDTVLDLFVGTNLSNQFDATMMLQAQIPVGAYSVPPSAPQPNSAQKLDTLDGRFQQSSAQYANKLWNVHTSNQGGGLAAPHFYEIDTTANSIIQDGDFYESSTSFDFNPSITANSSDDAFVTWTTTNASSANPKHNAAMRVSGRQAADGPGIDGFDGVTLATSPTQLTGNKLGKIQAWGAYSNVTLDPVASTCGTGQRVAVFNETILNADAWGSRFGIVSFCQ